MIEKKLRSSLTSQCKLIACGNKNNSCDTNLIPQGYSNCPFKSLPWRVTCRISCETGKDLSPYLKMPFSTMGLTFCRIVNRDASAAPLTVKCGRIHFKSRRKTRLQKTTFEVSFPHFLWLPNCLLLSAQSFVSQSHFLPSPAVKGTLAWVTTLYS